MAKAEMQTDEAKDNDQDAPTVRDWLDEKGRRMIVIKDAVFPLMQHSEDHLLNTIYTCTLEVHLTPVKWGDLLLGPLHQLITLIGGLILASGRSNAMLSRA